MALVRMVVAFMMIIISAQCESEEVSVADSVVPVILLRDESTKQCSVIVDHKSALSFDCEWSYLPEVLANYKDRMGEFQQILVIQESPMGNACNGGPLHIVGITQGKKVSVSRPIDFCGGKDQKISRKGTAVVITFPGGPPNRGSGRVPTEIWSYKDGHISRVK